MPYVRSPVSIEEESQALIRAAVGPHAFMPDEFAIVSRMIQDSADHDIAHTS